MNPVFSESFADGGVVCLRCVIGNVSTCGNQIAVPRISRPCLPSGMGFAENGLHTCSAYRLQGALRAELSVRFGFFEVNGSKQEINGWQYGGIATAHSDSTARFGSIGKNPSSTSDSLNNQAASRLGFPFAKHLINRGVFRDGATTPEQRGQNGPFSLLCHGRRRRS